MLFQQQINDVEQASEDIDDGVDALICNPPYYRHRISESAQLKYYVLSLEDTSAFLDSLLMVMMDLGRMG